MKKHKTTISYEGGLQKLVEDISDLRYDSLYLFLTELSQKIIKDSEADYERKRVQLALSLLNAGNELSNAAGHINESWKISKPYMMVEIIKDIIDDESISDEIVKKEIEKIDPKTITQEDSSEIFAFLQEKRPCLYKNPPSR